MSAVKLHCFSRSVRLISITVCVGQLLLRGFHCGISFACDLTYLFTSNSAQYTTYTAASVSDLTCQGKPFNNPQRGGVGCVCEKRRQETSFPQNKSCVVTALYSDLFPVSLPLLYDALCTFSVSNPIFTQYYHPSTVQAHAKCSVHC